MKNTLSVIIPVYGEKELVIVLYNRLVRVLKQMSVDYKIIYVNDADPHGCEVELEKIATVDDKVTLINLIRNFGEEFAVKAGIDYCCGDYAVIMDCDLQDKPEDIPLLYAKAKEGYNIVWGERVCRHDTLKKRFMSALFYFVFNLISDVKIKRKIGSFSIISKPIIDTLKMNKSYSFNYIQAVKYLGFDEAYVPIEKDKRPVGTSGYNFIKGLKLALKVLGSCPSKRLYMFVSISIYLSLMCFMFCLYLAVKIAENYFEPSLLFCLTLVLFGIVFIYISIIGTYLLTNIKESVMPYQYVIKNIVKKKNND